MVVFEHHVQIGLPHCHPAGSRVTFSRRIHSGSYHLKVDPLVGRSLSQSFDQSGNDASQAQYPSGGGDVLGEEDTGGGGEVTAEETDTVEDDAQVAQQVESGDSLPFTGFAAIPVVLAGVALIGGGLMLRRQSPSGD